MAEAGAASVAMALGLDVDVAISSAHNVVDNNAFQFAGKDESRALQEKTDKAAAGKLHKKMADKIEETAKKFADALGVKEDPDAPYYKEIYERGPEFYARYCIDRKEYQLGRTLRPEEIADVRWRAEMKYSIIADVINPSYGARALQHTAQFVDNLYDLPFTMAEHMAVRMGADPAEVRGVRLLAEDALMVVGIGGAIRGVTKGVTTGIVKGAAKTEAASSKAAGELVVSQHKPLELTVYAKPENYIDAGKMLPGEGKVGSYRDLTSANSQGSGLAAHHMPNSKYMQTKGVQHKDSIAMNMEHPHPGKGGRHREFHKEIRVQDPDLMPRDALAQTVKHAKEVYKKDGLYKEIKPSLREVIEKNKNDFPELFSHKDKK